MRKGIWDCSLLGVLIGWAGKLRLYSKFSVQHPLTSVCVINSTALAECTTNCSHFTQCEARRDEYYCGCVDGFAGGHCNININECASNPCVHGTCVDDVNSYRCVCDKGFWGDTCEKKIKDSNKGRSTTPFIRKKLFFLN